MAYERPPGRLLAELIIGDMAAWVTAPANGNDERAVRFAGSCDATLSMGGRRILMHPAVGADPGLISIFLSGSLLAHSLLMLGRLVLHASAVRTDSGAILFAGASGAGKSTLAALFCCEGATLIADDAVRVDAGEGGPVCYPGSNELRLRSGANELAQKLPAAAISSSPDGRMSVTPTGYEVESVRVGALVLPQPHRDEALHLEQLDPVAATVELLRYPRLLGWRNPETIQGIFGLTTSLAGAFPVFRASIPWGPPFPPHLPNVLLAGLGLDPLDAPDPRG